MIGPSDLSNFEIASNCRSFIKISRVLGDYSTELIYKSSEDKCKGLFNHVTGRHLSIPISFKKQPTNFYAQFTEALLEVSVQYHNLFRYSPNIKYIRKDLNFDFLTGIDSKNLIYLRSRIKYNKMILGLNEQNMPDDSDYYNDYILASIYSALPTRYFIFLDNAEYLGALPNRKAITIWHKTGIPIPHVKILNASDSFYVEKELQKRNLLLTCF